MVPWVLEIAMIIQMLPVELGTQTLILRTLISSDLLLTDADFLNGPRRIVSLGVEQMVGIWAGALCFYLYMR